MKNHFSPFAFKLFAIAAVVGMSACTLPERPADYRKAHPIVVQPETRVLSIMSRLEAEALAPEDQFAFDRFMRDYNMRASGFIGLQVPGNSASGIERKSRIEAMESLLTRAGVDRRMIRELPSGEGEQGAIIVSFTTNKAIVPECGDWSKSSSYNWANRRSPNYGCATQRNLGLTIANPGDLKKPADMEPLDGTRGASIYEPYRTPAAAAGAAEGAATE
jgi:pilus assembly protein CpaD